MSLQQAQRKVDAYLDLISIPENVDFDQYFNQEDKAKIKHAKDFNTELKQHYLDPSEAQGLQLPWKKTKNFRIRRAEMTLHTGYNGHRKSMMLGYWQLGLIAQNEICLSISPEMKPVKTLDRMFKQFTSFREPSLQIMDRFFDFLSPRLFIYNQLGVVNWRRVIAVSRYAIQELGVTQVFLDSLMKFDIKKKDLETQAEFVNELTTLAKDTDAHIHLVAHANKPSENKEAIAPEKYDVSGSSDITNMVDNVVVHHQVKDDAKEYDQLIIVEKQRNPEGDEAEPTFVFFFDDGSLQFKPSEKAYKVGMDEWEQCQWN